MNPVLVSVPAPRVHEAPLARALPVVHRAITAADRGPLGRMLADGAPFDVEERAIALELIDAAIADLGRPSLDPARSGYEVIVAERAGAPCGYVCYGPTPMTQGTWDLYWIVTDGAQRSRGVARGLVAEMERELRGRGGRLVRVETSRLEAYGAARAFYAAIGYPVMAILPDFYRRGDDLIIYLKAL